MWLEQREQPFVLGVRSDESLWWRGFVQTEAREIAASLPPENWRRLSAGNGTKGPRLYDWVWEPLGRLQITEDEKRWGHWLLVRRTVESDDDEFAYYVAFARREVTLEEVVRVAGMRWRIETCFEQAKGECGLDE